MTDWYFLLVPIAVLTVLLLFRFVGCTQEAFLGDPDEYEETVIADAPVAYFRFREKTGAVAINVMGGPNGAIGETVGPLDAGDPNWLSTTVAQPSIILGVTEPHLLQTDFSSYYSAFSFGGGYVAVPANVSPLNSLTEFTVEMLLYPQWDLEFGLGKYYCVLESADVVQIPGQTQPQLQKNAGFGIYAGPDNAADPASPYTWQFWVGVGQNGFERLSPVLPYPQPPNNPAPNPGPTVQPEITYLAVTFSRSQNQAFLYLFNPNRDLDYTTYQLNALPYTEAAQQLYVGLTLQGPLFPPFTGPTLLYPFQGPIGELAIYDKVLDESTLRNHVINAFFNT
jgi:hypothetical protein